MVSCAAADVQRCSLFTQIVQSGCARHLFDRMAQKTMDIPNGKIANLGDRISNLPDELLHHVMSFLPARDAVPTCVLSPRWRFLWVSARCLNVDAKGYSKRQFVQFVTTLLLRRGCTPLDSFWLRASWPIIFLNDLENTANDWICHALRSNVQVLGIVEQDEDIEYEEEEEEEVEAEDMEVGKDLAFRLNHYPFTSSYLKRLHLCFVSIDNQLTTRLFSGCQALEDLEMINCSIYATEFSSGTLKNLTIDYVGLPLRERHGNKHDIAINMPSLVLLRIGALLCKMPSLVVGHSLRIASLTLDHPSVTYADACGILGALSTVKNLELLFPNDAVNFVPSCYTCS